MVVVVVAVAAAFVIGLCDVSVLHQSLAPAIYFSTQHINLFKTISYNIIFMKWKYRSRTEARRPACDSELAHVAKLRVPRQLNELGGVNSAARIATQCRSPRAVHSSGDRQRSRLCTRFYARSSQLA